MTELSTDQLSYLAAKARLPEKLVLDAAKETVNRFLAVWDGGRFDPELSSKITEMINAHLSTIRLLSEVRS